MNRIVFNITSVRRTALLVCLLGIMTLARAAAPQYATDRGSKSLSGTLGITQDFDARTYGTGPASNYSIFDLSLSPVSVAELVHGIFRAKTPVASQRRRLYIEELVSLVPVHPVTRQTGWLVGQIQGQEAARGNVLPFNDLMIAAAAIEQGYAVLTGNVRHFQMIPGLQVVSFL